LCSKQERNTVSIEATTTGTQTETQTETQTGADKVVAAIEEVAHHLDRIADSLESLTEMFEECTYEHSKGRAVWTYDRSRE
jgi:hypothetical protein